LFPETSYDVQRIDLVEGKGFLLSGNKDQVENVQDKKIEPAVPDEKEVVKIVKQAKENEKLPKNVNTGLCDMLFLHFFRPLLSVVLFSSRGLL